MDRPSPKNRQILTRHSLRCRVTAFRLHHRGYPGLSPHTHPVRSSSSADRIIPATLLSSINVAGGDRPFRSSLERASIRKRQRRLESLSMPLKSIAVFVDPSPAGLARTSYAVRMALRHGAHLIGIFAVPPVSGSPANRSFAGSRLFGRSSPIPARSRPPR